MPYIALASFPFGSEEVFNWVKFFYLKCKSILFFVPMILSCQLFPINSVICQYVDVDCITHLKDLWITKRKCFLQYYYIEHNNDQIDSIIPLEGRNTLKNENTFATNIALIKFIGNWPLPWWALLVHLCSFSVE